MSVHLVEVYVHWFLLLSPFAISKLTRELNSNFVSWEVAWIPPS